MPEHHFLIGRTQLPILHLIIFESSLSVRKAGKKMGILSNLKNFIYKADFFYTAELLRYRQQPEYRTLVGGVLSISIIIALMVTFYNKVIDTLDMIIISSNVAATNADDPTPYLIKTYPLEPFMLGVEVWHHNVNEGERYFDITLINRVLYTGEPQDMNVSVEVALQPCTVDHWAAYPEVQHNFDRLHINYWKCLPMNATFEIKGKYASVESKTLEIAIGPCTNNSLDPRPCADQQAIDAYMEQYGNFFYTVYFLNPLINPGSQEYLSYYLEDSNYIIFSSTGGEEAQILIEDFTITTDESILPFSNIKKETGGIVSKNAIKNRYTVGADYETYSTFFFFKSPRSITIDRSFQKIDEVLSYLGGLFGTIAICLFLVNVYNSYSFQITLGGYLYKEDESVGAKYRKYNFLFFLSQLLYALLDIIGVKPNWPKIKKYYDCRTEMLQQLDILYLIKRVIYLERAMDVMLDDHQLKGIHLMNQLTLEEARKTRKKHRLRYRAIRECTKDGNNLSLLGNVEPKATKDASNPLNGQSIIENVNGSIQELNLIKPESNNNVFSYNFHKDEFSSNKAEKKKQKSEKEQEKDSESESDGEDENVLETLMKIKNEQDKNEMNRKIWTNLDTNIKQFISSSKDSDELMPINNEDPFELQQHNTARYDSQEDPNNNRVHNRENALQNYSQNPTELPKIYRKAAGKIIMNGGGMGVSNESSLQTEQLRRRHETRAQRRKKPVNQ